MSDPRPVVAVVLAPVAGLTGRVVEAADARAVLAESNRAWAETACHLLLVSAPVEVPAGMLDPALRTVNDDRRVGTVSFLCNEAGFLSFPAREATTTDVDALTRILRDTGPPLAPSPIPFAAGPAVLVSAYCLSAVGPLPEGDDVAAALVAFSLRARRRGFFSLLDPSTFYRTSAAAPFAPTDEPAATLVREYESPLSPLTTVRRAAEAKVCGLRVLIDAARLTPQEMGTQVATVALIRALARRPDVARVCVALVGDLPPYAASLRDDPKVDARVVQARDFSVFGEVDVAHRPFQPDSPTDMLACQAVAHRTVVTILDLIAYHAVSYQLEAVHWTTYRDWLRRSIAQADAVVTISDDVRRQVLLERLPVDPERLFVAELGTDHLTGDEPASPPATVPAEPPFVVVLGADYTHKNRDLAVAAHRLLCERGFAGPLVLAGMGVHGSSRDLEQQAMGPGQQVMVLPDVTSEERNWLLRQAALVLYPTSGEGFGLVPFEAARFGTPTVFVPFGPLAELAGELPVEAADWSPPSLAAAATRLLDDEDLARAQVAATVAAADRWRWDATAAKLAETYRLVLSRPVAARAVAFPADTAHEADTQLRALRSEHEELRAAYDAMQRSGPYRLAVRAADLRRRLRDSRP